jgi:hypothetical protein
MPLDYLDSPRWGCGIVAPADEHGRMQPFQASLEFDLDGYRWKVWSWDDVDLIREPTSDH